MLASHLFSLLPLLLLGTSGALAHPTIKGRSDLSASTHHAKRQGGQCPAFPLREYADFQTSSGTAGDAEVEANAIFVDPFAGCDLSTVDEESLQNIKTMREAAEDAETELFNPQIEAASGADADALQVGKIKNKVLKLTGFQQALAIEIAQGGGADRQAKLDEEQGKLTKNIATDQASAGEPSQAAFGGGNAAAADVADNADAEQAETENETASSSTCTCAK